MSPPTLTERLQELQQRPRRDESKITIFRVQEDLRQVENEAYEPIVVSLGPYHRGKERLQPMEHRKLLCLQRFLQRIAPDSSLENCLQMLKEVEGRTRDCYQDRMETISSDEFVDMLMLDACFLLEFLLHPREAAGSSALVICVKKDALLLENQIPFFILQNLFWLINDDKLKSTFNLEWFERTFHLEKFESTSDRKRYLDGLLLEVVKNIIGTDFLYYLGLRNIVLLEPGRDPEHLLDLLHQWIQIVPTNAVTTAGESNQRSEKWPDSIQSATKLKERGIRFKVLAGDNFPPFHVAFGLGDGCLEMSNITISDQTQTFLRNLLALEQYGGRRRRTYIVDYVVFLDYLIDTAEDVALLQESGILMHGLGNDQEVADLVNRLCKNVVWNPETKHFRTIFNDVNAYCAKPWPKHRTMLIGKYFRNPWSIISLLAASVLLILTLLQTIFTILSYVQSKA